MSDFLVFPGMLKCLLESDHGVFFVKLDFEIAVDQQTRTSDPTFGGFHRCPRGSHAHIWSNFGKSAKHGQNPDLMRFTCICPYLGMRTKFDRFWLINWSNINIF